MLGRFLELALVTDDTGAAWQRWQALGFAAATAGDVWSHPYGVVACRQLAIGLHARGDEPLGLVFVREDVAGLHRELTARGIRIETARLGSDVFNELTLREPGGIALRVIEARTFSPPPELPARTRLGTLQQLSLPCRDLDAAAAFWSGLGMATTGCEEPWAGLAVGGTPLACHVRRQLPEPVLVFSAPPAPLDGIIETADLQRERAPPLGGDHTPTLLRTRDELALLVFD